MNERRFIEGPAYTNGGWIIRLLMDRRTGEIYGKTFDSQVSPRIAERMPVVKESLTLGEMVGKAIAWLRRDF